MSTGQRTRARKGEGEKLRAEILEATEALLIETGAAEAVSIRAVAERVGVTSPSIYRHFADKQQLLFEVCDVEFDRLGEAINELAADVTNPVEFLRRAGRAYVTFACRYPEQYRIMLLGTEQFPAELYLERDDTAFNILTDMVDRLVAGGCLRPSLAALDRLELALLIWASVHGLAAMMVARPSLPWPDLDTVINHHLDLVFGGLLA